MSELDLGPLEKAVISLEKIIDRYERDNHDIDIRDAVIQRFEYTFSTAVKMIYRSLRELSPEDEPENYNQAIRLANKKGILLNNFAKWDDYRKKRNMTSHLYDEKWADEIVGVVPDFIQDVNFLIKKLKEVL